MKFVVIDLDTGKEVSRVDLNDSTEYKNNEWNRFIADNLDNQSNILVLFEEDIDYDFYSLHQCLIVYPDGHVEDIRRTEYVYRFHIEKTLPDSGKVVEVSYKEYKFDEELSDEDIEELRVAIGATRITIDIGKYPSDDELYRIEGKTDLIKGNENENI